jgi:hypothetical protein
MENENDGCLNKEGRARGDEGVDEVLGSSLLACQPKYRYVVASYLWEVAASGGFRLVYAK